MKHHHRLRFKIERGLEHSYIINILYSYIINILYVTGQIKCTGSVNKCIHSSEVFFQELLSFHRKCIQQWNIFLASNKQTSQINESFTVMLLHIEFTYFIYQHVLNLNRLLTVKWENYGKDEMGRMWKVAPIIYQKNAYKIINQDGWPIGEGTHPGPLKYEEKVWIIQ